MIKFWNLDLKINETNQSTFLFVYIPAQLILSFQLFFFFADGGVKLASSILGPSDK